MTAKPIAGPVKGDGDCTALSITDIQVLKVRKEQKQTKERILTIVGEDNVEVTFPGIYQSI